nr:hypothetical protein B0A51_11479 [Rachicladosporium sp. CCFEE 5018]
MLRTAFARNARLFSTSIRTQKLAVDAAKETAADLNKVAGEKAAAGIEQAQQAAQKAKEAIGINAAEAKAKASEVTGATQGDAAKLSGQAQGKAEELTGKAKGAINEAAGKAKATAEEVKAKV